MADDDKKKKTAAADEATARARADFAAAKPAQRPEEGPAVRLTARRIDLAREIYVNSFAGGKPTSPDVALVRADEFLARMDEIRGIAAAVDRARSA